MTSVVVQKNHILGRDFNSGVLKWILGEEISYLMFLYEIDFFFFWQDLSIAHRNNFNVFKILNTYLTVSLNLLSKFYFTS